MARLRLVINLKDGRGSIQPEFSTRRLNGKNFASTIVSEVGLEYSQKEYQALRDTIRDQVSRDVHREIQHVARQYVDLIIGARNQRSSRATLRSSTQGSPTAGGFATAEAQVSLPNRPWAPLSPRYAAWKAKHNYPAGHFQLSGFLGREMGKGSTWTGVFGPVSIRVLRTSNDVKPQIIPTIRQGFNQIFSVGKIEVRALGQIDANMLPALTKGGGIGFSGDGNALMSLVYNKNKELEYGLAGNMARVPYRPTLEPFLGFLLSKAIPAAVHNRVATLTYGKGAERPHTAKRFT